MKQNEELISEAKIRLNNLVNYSAQRREWYQSLGIRIADRQSEHVSLISSIAAAILALIVSLGAKNSFWVGFSFWSLLTTVILGTVLILLLIIFDSKVSMGDRDVELSAIEHLKVSTKDFLKGEITDKRHERDFSEEYKRIEGLPNKYDFVRRYLDFFYFVVLISFIIGMFGLMRSWIDAV